MMNKKGISGVMIFLVFTMVAIVAGILVALIFRDGAGGISDAFGAQFSALGDCDGDGYPNGGFFSTKDQCPCLATGGEGSETFKGCPAGTTQEGANNDQKTCNEYTLEGTSKGETYKTEEACNEKYNDNNEKCVTRCETAEKIAEATATASEDKIVLDGRVCNCDIQIDKLTVNGNEVKSIVKMQDEKQVKVKVVAKLKYTGEKFSETVQTQLYLCVGEGKGCDKVGNGKIYSGSEALKQDFSEEITIGKEDDACDGPGTITCYLKFEIDFGDNNILNEGSAENEMNNLAYVKLQLDNQKYDPFGFDSYRTIGLYGESDEPLANGAVVDYCKGGGYIGLRNADDKPDNKDRTCDSHYKKKFSANNCNKEYFDENIGKSLMDSSGCWMTIVEDDSGEGDRIRDCAVAVAKPGAIIGLKPSSILWDSNAGMGGSDPKQEEEEPWELLTNPAFKWKAPTSTGALLCTLGDGNYGASKYYWEACNGAANKKIAVTPDGTAFRCKGGEWTKLG
jgi:hypothetical protein